MLEGHTYEVSFYVSKGVPYNGVFPYSGHSLKRISALFRSDSNKLDLGGKWFGYDATELERENVMVEDHDDPSGFLKAYGSNWNKVSGEITAPLDLDFMYIGSFDLDFDSTGSSLFEEGVLIDSIPLDTINSVYRTNEYQNVYYYIDSVRVELVDAVTPCDCDDLVEGVEFFSVHLNEEGSNKCCRSVHMKVSGQDDDCYISEFRWRRFGEPTYNNVHLYDDLGKKLNDDKYIPVDTICELSVKDGFEFRYEFEFRTFGSDTWGCNIEYLDTLDCDACPCDWINDPGQDPFDSTKKAVRYEYHEIASQDSTKCCYELMYINNSDKPIYADIIKAYTLDGDFTNTNNEYIYDSSPQNQVHTWEITTGEISPGDTVVLGELCLDKNSSTITYLDLSFYYGGSIISCYESNQEILISCDDCCPLFDIDSKFIVNDSTCCVEITNIDIDNCGSYYKLYKIDNGNEVELVGTLPQRICSDDSDLLAVVKIFDSNDNITCTKEFNYEHLLDRCDCCDDLGINIIEDSNYSGDSCRFIINNILDTRCGFEGTSNVVWGTLSENTFDSLGVFDFEDFADFSFKIPNCTKDTLRFDIYRAGEIRCQIEKPLSCQNCSDANVSIENYPFDSTMISVNCCLAIIFKNENPNCDYSGIIYKPGQEIKPTIPTWDGEQFETTPDTLVACGDQEFVRFYFGIYDENGKLICTFSDSKRCLGNSSTAKSTPKIIDIESESILLSSQNELEIKTFESDETIVEIFSLEGKSLYSNTITGQPNSSVIIDISNYNSGTYPVLLKSKNQTKVIIIKLVK